MGQSKHIQCNIYFSDKPSNNREFTDEELDENRAYMFFQEKLAQGYASREIIVDALNALADGDIRYRRRDIPIAEAVIREMIQQSMDMIVEQMEGIASEQVEAINSLLAGASLETRYNDTKPMSIEVDDKSSIVMGNILSSLSSRRVKG